MKKETKNFIAYMLIIVAGWMVAINFREILINYFPAVQVPLIGVVIGVFLFIVVGVLLKNKPWNGK